MGSPRRVSRPLVLLTLAGLWLVTTVALAAWWWIHGLEQIRFYTDLRPAFAVQMAAQHRMIFWEGLSLLLLLLIGGVSLFLLITREFRRNSQVGAFFATFTHEIKTPLASLRLQAEALGEDLMSDGHSNRVLVERLLGDAARLELQLDNALFLATVRGSDQIHLEPVSLAQWVERVRTSFPEMNVTLSADVRVMADRRALESVLKNLIQNARVHGRATEMKISVGTDPGLVYLTIEDNGQGFAGNSGDLGRLFHRHTSQSGSGIGLHLARMLVQRMRGELTFGPGNSGFRVEMTLRAAG